MIFELHNKQMLENVTNPWPGKKFKYQLKKSMRAPLIEFVKITIALEVK